MGVLLLRCFFVFLISILWWFVAGSSFSGGLGDFEFCWAFGRGGGTGGDFFEEKEGEGGGFCEDVIS